jgi:dimethylhistidine N-methyltransferase
VDKPLRSARPRKHKSHVADQEITLGCGAAAEHLVPSLDMRDDVLARLLTYPKTLPSKYLYDAEGSRLFERICDLPEYYVARTELELLRLAVPDIIEGLPRGAALVEFGSGASVKTRLLLDGGSEFRLYVPIDISQAALVDAARSIREAYPDLEVCPLIGDFTQSLVLPSSAAGLPVVGFFPGSTIGNLAPGEAKMFLEESRNLLGRRSSLIVGVDLAKSADVLIPAYDDAEGVTAAFNKNLLTRLNREFDAEFALEDFEHLAVWNQKEGRMEMHLVSSREHTVRVGEWAIEFAAGETIHTENSYKYPPEAFRKIAEEAGWQTCRIWTSENPKFAIFKLTA